MSDPNEQDAIQAGEEATTIDVGPTQPDPAALPDRAAAPSGETAGETAGLDLLLDVPVHVTVEIGSARMLVQELLQLDAGSVVELDRMAGEPADVLVNGRVVARGEILVTDDRLSVRLVEIVSGGRREDRAR